MKRLGAKEIKAVRRKLGVSQLQMAAELGVTQSAVSAWESGRRSPTVAMTSRISALASMDPAVVAERQLVTLIENSYSQALFLANGRALAHGTCSNLKELCRPGGSGNDQLLANLAIIRAGGLFDLRVSQAKMMVELAPGQSLGALCSLQLLATHGAVCHAAFEPVPYDFYLAYKRRKNGDTACVACAMSDCTPFAVSPD